MVIADVIKITDVLMVILTGVYVVATIILCNLNRKAIKESKQQYENSIELQKQHNYDTVRPAVTIKFSTSHKPNAFSGKITVYNHGLGPAVLNDLHFTRKGKQYLNQNGYCTAYNVVHFRTLEENISLKGKKIFKHFYTKEFRNLSEDMDYLAVNEELLLLSFDAENRNNSELVGRIFDDVRMELIYTDIYGSKEWRVMKDLSYFKPTWM